MSAVLLVLRRSVNIEINSWLHCVALNVYSKTSFINNSITFFFLKTSF